MQDTTVAKGSDSSAWQGSRDVLSLEPTVRPLPNPPRINR